MKFGRVSIVQVFERLILNVCVYCVSFRKKISVVFAQIEFRGRDRLEGVNLIERKLRQIVAL